MKVSRLAGALTGRAARLPSAGQSYQTRLVSVSAVGRTQVLHAGYPSGPICVQNCGPAVVYVGGPSVSDTGTDRGFRLDVHDVLELGGARDLYAYADNTEGGAELVLLIDPEE